MTQNQNTAPRVLISDKMSSRAADIFRNRGIHVDVTPSLSPTELQAAIHEYDGLAIRSATKVTPEILNAATRLKVVGRAGIGVDNVDLSAATAKGVVVMNTPHGNAITTAEHAIAMLFAVARQIPAASHSTHQGKWEKSRFMGTEITGKTLGLIGAGNIGSIVAERALGLRMKVLAFDPFLTESRAKTLGVQKVSLDVLLKNADIITLHVPKTPETSNIIDATALNKMKRGAYLINCARGGLVDENAVSAALQTGHLAGVGFDVFSEEPAKENPLFGLENVVCTPHLGAATTEAQEKVAVQIAEQISDFLLEGAVQNAVNAPSMNAKEAKQLAPYLKLSEQLGSMAGQLTEDEIKAIRIEYAGKARDLNHTPLTQTIVKAVLAPKLSSINMVNAIQIAKDRDIEISTAQSEGAINYATRLTVEVETKSKVRHLRGTLLNEQEPRLVEIKGISLESKLQGHMLYVTNRDQVGLIGNLGMLLASSGVNIATFHLGRTEEGGEAVSLVEIDSELPDQTLSQIRALPQVDRADYLRF